MSLTMRRFAAIAQLSSGSAVAPVLRYKLGIISDSHSGYTNAVPHLTATLNTLHNRGAQEIVTCGDSAVNGTQAEWEQYISTIESSPYKRTQVHECNGNHDGAAPDLTTFKQYSNNGALVGKDPYFAIDLFGDRFIFLAFDVGTSPSGGNCFSTAQLDWLEEELQEHYGKGKNVWIIEHSLFYGWGAGDIISAPRYPRALSLSFDSHIRLKSILEAHPKLIFLHGHTHIRLEDVSEGLVAHALPADAGCNQIHVPAVTAGKFIGGSGEPSADFSMDPECWYCEVYTNKIVFIGLNGNTGEEIANVSHTIAV